MSKPERPLIPEEQIASLRTGVETLVFLGELGYGEGDVDALVARAPGAPRAAPYEIRGTWG